LKPNIVNPASRLGFEADASARNAEGVTGGETGGVLSDVLTIPPLWEPFGFDVLFVFVGRGLTG